MFARSPGIVIPDVVTICEVQTILRLFRHPIESVFSEKAGRNLNAHTNRKKLKEGNNMKLTGKCSYLFVKDMNQEQGHLSFRLKEEGMHIGVIAPAKGRE